MCDKCGATSISHRHNLPWCEHCGIYLIHHAASGQWVSFAEKSHRDDQERYARWGEQSRARISSELIDIRGVTPTDWTARVHDVPSALPCIELSPPTGQVVVSAWLFPPHDGRPDGWHVRMHNRFRGIDFPLYIPGGARAAYFTTAAIATRKAVDTVRAELNATYQRNGAHP